MTIRFQFFPKALAIPPHLKDVVSSFEEVASKIETPKNQLNSNEVLEFVRPGLEFINFEVEKSGSNSHKVIRPVLFGEQGKIEKSFVVDGFEPISKTVIEVEAGRGVANHQFLKDFFEACVIQDVDYLVIAVCKGYQPKSFKNPVNDFETVTTFFDTLYTSNRLVIPLKGLLVIGY